MAKTTTITATTKKSNKAQSHKQLISLLKLNFSKSEKLKNMSQKDKSIYCANKGLSIKETVEVTGCYANNIKWYYYRLRLNKSI